MKITVPVSPGELIDKLTILEIKAERISDPAKLAKVQREQQSLRAVHTQELPESAALGELTQKLKAANEQLWVIEDDIRRCERDQRFDGAFVALARAVYRTNDERSRIKAAIDHHLNAELTEIKSYEAY
ncbi:MAG: DUF6165 family protein [Myxococcota bacterium]|jgi:hypothetical protein|nr:DUF6165 family protein [Myxococcota bacterium]